MSCDKPHPPVHKHPNFDAEAFPVDWDGRHSGMRSRFTDNWCWNIEEHPSTSDDSPRRMD
jgi:hypothetical protein